MCLLCTVAISLCKRCLLVFNVAFPSDHVHDAWHQVHTPSTDCWTIASIWAICRPSSALLHYRATTLMDNAARAAIIVGTSLGRGRKASGTWARDASAGLGRSDIARIALNGGGCDPKCLGPFHGQALGLALLRPGTIWESPLATAWDQQEELLWQAHGWRVSVYSARVVDAVAFTNPFAAQTTHDTDRVWHANCGFAPLTSV